MNIILDKRPRTLNFVLAVLLLTLTQIIVSCNWPGENPDLVNPPLKSPTIGLRYLNLSGGGENRTLRLNYNDKIENVPFGTVSLQKNPPADSVYLTVDKNGSQEYAQKKPLKFLTRNINYTLISLASKKGAKNYRETDTIIWLATSLINPENDNDAMLRLFNGVPDSSVSYSVNVGCPNGKVILAQQRYGKVSSQFENIRSGEVPVSILKHKNNETTIVGVYKLNIKAKGQYCIIILPVNDVEVVYLYDELSKGDNPMSPAELLIEKEASVRILNFSTENFTVKTGQEEVIVDNLASNKSSSYKTIKACDSQNNDFVVFTSNSANYTDTVSFEVMGVYNYIIADNKDKVGDRIIRIPPLYFPSKSQDEATIRVVHTAWNRSGITLSMGLRNTAKGTKIGERLVEDLQYGEVSAPISVPAGYAPLTSFSATEPAKLLESAVGEFVKGKSYIAVLASSSEGYDRIYIIEDSEAGNNLVPQPTGVFTQIVAAAAGVDNVKIDLIVDGKQYLKDITIPASGVIATVIPQGEATISAGGVTNTAMGTYYNRLLFIVSGDRNKLDIFNVNSPQLYPDDNFYRRRFLNAVYSIFEIAVKEEKDNPSNLAPIIATTSYGKVSDVSMVWLESRKSFRFFDTSQNTQIFKSGDLSFSFNKSYSIIFAGSAPTGYSVIIVQEF